jgi:hypothetical protein
MFINSDREGIIINEFDNDKKNPFHSIIFLTFIKKNNPL